MNPDPQRHAADVLGAPVLAAAPFSISRRPRLPVGGVGGGAILLAPYVLWELNWRWRHVHRLPEPAYLAVTAERIAVFGFVFGRETHLTGPPETTWGRDAVSVRQARGKDEFRVILAVAGYPGPLAAHGFQRDEGTRLVIRLLGVEGA